MLGTRAVDLLHIFRENIWGLKAASIRDSCCFYKIRMVHMAILETMKKVGHQKEKQRTMSDETEILSRKHESWEDLGNHPTYLSCVLDKEETEARRDSSLSELFGLTAKS